MKVASRVTILVASSYTILSLSICIAWQESSMLRKSSFPVPMRVLTRFAIRKAPICEPHDLSHLSHPRVSRFHLSLQCNKQKNLKPLFNGMELVILPHKSLWLSLGLCGVSPCAVSSTLFISV